MRLLEKERSFACALQSGFEEFYQLTHENSLILCARRLGDSERGSGMSFWIHAGSGIVLIGLWSGAVYRLPVPSSVLRLVEDSFSTDYFDAESTPYSFPGALIDRYGLEESKFYELYPKFDGCEDIRAIRARAVHPYFAMQQFADSVVAQTESCCVLPMGFVRFSKGSLTGLVRFKDILSAQRSVLVLICNRSGHWEPHVNLLMTLSDSLQCSAYDQVWNNLIYFDDPYYRRADRMSGPESPRNRVFYREGRP